MVFLTVWVRVPPSAPVRQQEKGLIRLFHTIKDICPHKIAFNYLAGEISPREFETIGTLASGPDANASYDNVA